MKSFTIIGPGLIGASLGLILKKKKLASVIYGYDVNKDNLKDAIVLGNRINLKNDYSHINNIVIAGMGGSAIGGDIVSVLENSNIR